MSWPDLCGPITVARAVKRSMLAGLCLIGVAVLPARMEAQAPYAHHLDHGCIWYKEMQGADGFNAYYTRLTEYVDGDTVIDGRGYFKLYHVRWDSTVHVMFPAPPTITTSGPNWSGTLREDSLNRFWEWRSWLNEDGLLNDFNLIVGDTFPQYACTIDSMAVTYFNGNTLKKFYSAWNTLGDGVIEGVGNTALPCGFGFESNTWVVCFSKQGLTLQIDSAYDCSIWPAPIYQFGDPLGLAANGSTDRLNCYPSPSEGELIVEAGLLGMRRVEIIDALGRLLVMDLSLPTDRLVIDLGSMSSGVGVVRVLPPGGAWISKRFVKR